VYDIDIQQTMKVSAGLDMLPYRILGACNPTTLSTPGPSGSTVGLLLPCKRDRSRQTSHDALVVGIPGPSDGGAGWETQLSRPSLAAEERLRRVCASPGAAGKGGHKEKAGEECHC
jgi:hypothetical protein